jgi:hypothetical protein
MTKGAWRLECSLLYHGEYGVEAQFLLDGELHIGRTFIMKELAVAWAESERRARTADGWLQSDIAQCESRAEDLPGPRAARVNSLG